MLGTGLCGNYLEVVEEDGGIEESAGAEPGGDGEAGLPRDRQPRGGHGLVPRARARTGERRHAPIREDRLLRRAPGAGGEVPGARVWRISHCAGVRRGLSEEDERDRQGREERERRGGFGGDSGKGSLGKVAPSRSGGRVGVGGHDTC